MAHRATFQAKNMGITEELLIWISYLSDRQQRVVLQDESSCWADINTGIPQGSVLGPLLFSKLTLFADNNLVLSISNCHIF